MLSKDYGYPIYEADRRVKELYLEHPRLLTDIEVALGDTFRNEEGEFQPAKLAERIFSHNEDLHKVESMVFPVLMEDFHSWKKKNADNEYLVLESATILEKPSLLGLGDLIIVVDAPLQLRVGRAMSRDGVPEKIIRDRVASQKLMNEISEGRIPENVDFVIKNDGDIEMLAERLKAFVTMSEK